MESKPLIVNTTGFNNRMYEFREPIMRPGQITSYLKINFAYSSHKIVVTFLLSNDIHFKKSTYGRRHVLVVPVIRGVYVRVPVVPPPVISPVISPVIFGAPVHSVQGDRRGPTVVVASGML